MDSSEQQFASARLAQRERHHDDRLRVEIFAAVHGDAGRPTVDWALLMTKRVYEEVTGRKWARPPQDAS